MRAVDIIIKKREGGILSFEEIDFLIMGYVRGEIPDYQISAWLMASFLKGLNVEETYSLTKIMRDSGDKIDLSGISKPTIDKHSTGGVGDKVSLIAAPLLAAFGLAVPKMSGRGLGHTGGTVDKLEAIPGFQVELEGSALVRQVNDIGLAIIAQTGNITPADKKLYALRDVTGTVDTISLITASIMSKKLAAGAEHIILDVKYGSGAFMKNPGDAQALAKGMVEIGKSFGKKIRALVTNMNQPLGHAVGNALEVIEVAEVLKGRGPADLRELSSLVVAHGLVVAKVFPTLEVALAEVEKKLENGEGLSRLGAMIAAQGGDPLVLENYKLLPGATGVLNIHSRDKGYLSAIDVEAVGHASMLLGAGRATKDDRIDPGVGLHFYPRIGDKVEPGALLAELYYNDKKNLEEAEYVLRNSLTFSCEPVQGDPLIYTLVQ